MSDFELGYWPIRGLAQPIRYLLAYTGLPYHDMMFKERDDFILKVRPEHMKVTNFPNLPYLSKGPEFVLTES
jgi:glutathione S-transferase